ncbi:syntaxin-18-like isoform X2 [Dysidea avara]
MKQISKLRDFLLEHRKNYIDTSGHLVSSTHTGMTDAERDSIDSEAQQYMKLCTDAIKQLGDYGSVENIPTQAQIYHKEVQSLLESFLKEVCRLYSEQRAVRVKRIVERKQISRLLPRSYQLKATGASNEDSSSSPEDKPEPSDSKTEPNGEDTKPAAAAVAVTTTATEEDNFTSKLSAEELNELEQENQLMFSELNSVADEVKQIEGKVVEISQLVDVFSEKILQQSEIIDTVADMAVEATENVKGGNEEVRQAIKNRASFRAWILFILIVCSFSLLFLDWYS